MQKVLPRAGKYAKSLPCPQKMPKHLFLYLSPLVSPGHGLISLIPKETLIKPTITNNNISNFIILVFGIVSSVVTNVQLTLSYRYKQLSANICFGIIRIYLTYYLYINKYYETLSGKVVLPCIEDDNFSAVTLNDFASSAKKF